MILPIGTLLRVFLAFLAFFPFQATYVQLSLSASYVEVRIFRDLHRINPFRLSWNLAIFLVFTFQYHRRCYMVI